jgi:hypothetical protein
MMRASVQPDRSRLSAIQEQPIEAIQFGTGLLPLEDNAVLAKSGAFHCECVARKKEGASVSDHRISKDNHQSDLS